MHAQWYASVASTHVPPCWQVTSRQSSTLTSQVTPLKPGWQRHIGLASCRTQWDEFTAHDRLWLVHKTNSVNNTTKLISLLLLWTDTAKCASESILTMDQSMMKLWQRLGGSKFLTQDVAMQICRISDWSLQFDYYVYYYSHCWQLHHFYRITTKFTLEQQQHYFFEGLYLLFHQFLWQKSIFFTFMVRGKTDGFCAALG